MMPLSIGPSEVLIEVLCGPVRLPPKILVLRPELVDAADDADAVGRIGRDVDDVGAGRLDGADDRAEIGRVSG